MTALPAGWRLVRLGEVADSALGKMLDKGVVRGHGQVPYLRNVNVQWGRVDLDSVFTMELADHERERFAVEDGDLLVCEGGEIGRSAIWRGRGEYIAYQKALHRIRSRGLVDQVYLRYLFEHYAKNGTLKRHSTGSTIAHLPQQRLKGLPVPLPPLEEQRRIVDVLEDHLSRLDAAEDLRNASALRLKALRSSSLATIIDRSDRPRTQLSELVAGIEAGRSFGGSAGPAGPGEWGIVKVSSMTWGAFRADENKAVPAEMADARYEIKAGDLLVSRANTTDYVGASVLVGHVRPRLLLSDKSLRVVPHLGVDARWLQMALSTPAARSEISARATGTKDSMRNISQANLLSIDVPHVSDADQAADVAELSGRFESVDRLASTLRALGQRSAALRRGLLAAAFSGELTGRSSDLDRVEEPAVAGASA